MVITKEELHAYFVPRAVGKGVLSHQQMTFHHLAPKGGDGDEMYMGVWWRS